MNDEIKVLIEDMQRFDNKWRNFDIKLAIATYPINQEQMPILLDYITNLQEELDRCVKANVILDNENTELQERIDKAIDYIEEKGRLKYKPDELLNILKGDSSNE